MWRMAACCVLSLLLLLSCPSQQLRHCGSCVALLVKGREGDNEFKLLIWTMQSGPTHLGKLQSQASSCDCRGIIHPTGARCCWEDCLKIQTACQQVKQLLLWQLKAWL